jgi:tetratricopeptide (TPR) repeat protein
MGKMQVQPGALNDADRLRAQIDEAERLSARLTAGNSRDAVLAVHRAEQMIAALGASGPDLRGERTRIDALHNVLTRNAGRIVKALGGPLGFQRLRRESRGEIAWPVWQLDRRVHEIRRRRLRLTGVTVAVVLAVGLGAYLARDILLPPDPVGDALSQARAAYADGDSERAITALDLGLTQAPTSTQLLIWKGVLLEGEGDPGAALQFERARTVAPQTQFLFERAMVYVELQDADAVLTDANAMIAQQPEMPEGYFVRASGYELKENLPAALADLEKAAALADAQGNAPLYAAAKVRIGSMLR